MFYRQCGTCNERWAIGEVSTCKCTDKKPKREWVGLTGNEARNFYEKYTDREELIHAIDKFLEEKNGGQN